MDNFTTNQPSFYDSSGGASRPATIRNAFHAISAEEYEKFRRHVITTEQPPKRSNAGIALTPSDPQSRAIEVMCSGISVALLEVFAGRRPVKHISKWLSRECQEKIEVRSQITAAALHRKYSRIPLNDSPLGKGAVMPKPRRVRAQKVSDTSYEVCLIMQDFARVRAIAMRVEKVFTAWKVTALEIA